MDYVIDCDGVKIPLSEFNNGVRSVLDAKKVLLNLNERDPGTWTEHECKRADRLRVVINENR